jgi:Transposase, Mutator family
MSPINAPARPTAHGRRAQQPPDRPGPASPGRVSLLIRTCSTRSALRARARSAASSSGGPASTCARSWTARWPMCGLPLKGRCCVVALGVTTDGVKVPLGLWDGSTENKRVCAELLANLVDRGLDCDQGVLVVLDGGPTSSSGLMRLRTVVSFLRTACCCVPRLRARLDFGSYRRIGSGGPKC